MLPKTAKKYNNMSYNNFLVSRPDKNCISWLLLWNKSTTHRGYPGNICLSWVMNSVKKYYIKKKHYFKNIACRIMPYMLQLYLTLISKYSKFCVEIFKTFWVMGYIKVLHHNEDLNNHRPKTYFLQYFRCSLKKYSGINLSKGTQQI